MKNRKLATLLFSLISLSAVAQEKVFLGNKGTLIYDTSAVIDARSFGAIGDGATDNTASIQRAADSAKMSYHGTTTLFLGTGTFKIRRPIKLASNVKLVGAGKNATIITKGASVKTLLVADAALGATSVDVTSASGFNVGDAVNIQDDVSYEWVSTQAVITSIVGSTITLDHTLDTTYLTSRNAYMSSSFPLITNDSGSHNIGVSNLTLNQNYNSSDPSNNFTIGIIHWVESYDAVVENCILKNAATDAYSDQAQDGTYMGTPLASYIKTTRNIFRNNIIDTSRRHGVHLGTCMNGALIFGNRINNCSGMALFYCAFATNTIAENNLVKNCVKGFAGGDVRDSSNVISNNIFDSCTSWSIEPGASNIVSNNQIIHSSKGILVQYGNTTLSNNNISLTAGGENISVTSGGNNCTITGGHLGGKVTGGTSLLLVGCSNIYISNIVIDSCYKGADIRGVTNLRVVNTPILYSASNSGWVFNTTASTDVSIDIKGTLITTPITETVAPVRALYNGVGTNGTTSPAASGDWFVTGKKYDGAIVRWNDGVDHWSVYNSAIGWKEIVIPGTSPSFFAPIATDRMFFTSNTFNAADASSNSVIGGSNSTGGAAYPFLENGNLIIQPRTSGARDLVIMGGGVPSLIVTRGGKTLLGVNRATTGADSTVTIGNGAAGLKLALYSMQANSFLFGSATGAAVWSKMKWIMSYNVVAAATKTMLSYEGYISNSVANAQLVYTLPASPSIGDIFSVVGGTSTGGWKIQAVGSQTIRLGASTTTAAGSVVSGNFRDCVTLIYMTTDIFVIMSHEGTFTFN